MFRYSFYVTSSITPSMSITNISQIQNKGYRFFIKRLKIKKKNDVDIIIIHDAHIYKHQTRIIINHHEMNVHFVKSVIKIFGYDILIYSHTVIQLYLLYVFTKNTFKILIILQISMKAMIICCNYLKTCPEVDSIYCR